MKPVDAELSALFSAARAAESPSAEEKAAVRAAVSVAVAAAVVGATLSAAAAQPLAPAAKALSLAKVLSWVATGAAVGVAASGVTWVAQSALSDEPRAAVTAAAPAISARPTSALRAAQARAPVASPSAELALAAEPVAAAPVAAAPVTPTGSIAALANAANSARERPATSLEAEARGLSAIQAALSRGDGRAALQLLGEQEREFPRGALDQERAAARVLAWCAAGQVEQAILARRRFLSAYPSSPWAKRVRESCAE